MRSAARLEAFLIKKGVLFCTSLICQVCVEACVCDRTPHMSKTGVYKVFRSTDLTLLFYRVYLYFPLDLRRTENIAVHILYYNSSFLFHTESFSFIIFKSLYHTSLKVNIVNFSNAWPLGPPKLIESLTLVGLNFFKPNICYNGTNKQNS